MWGAEEGGILAIAESGLGGALLATYPPNG
jgi:hypothetical protein